MRDAKGVSDSEYVLLVGEKGDYPHRVFAARTLEAEVSKYIERFCTKRRKHSFLGLRSR